MSEENTVSVNRRWLSHKAPRWLMALVVIVLFALVLIFPDAGTILLSGAVVVAVGIGLVSYQHELRVYAWRWLQVTHPRLFLLIAIILMCLSAYYFVPNPDAIFPLTPAVGRALVAFVAGTGFLILSLWLRAVDAPTDSVINHPHGVTPRWAYRPLVVTCGVGLLLFTAEVNAEVLKITWLQHIHYNVQIIALIAGIILTTFGMGYAPPHTDSVDSNEGVRPLRIPLWEGALIFGIAIFALFLRWWELDTRLLTLVDELNFISHVRHFWEFPNNPALRPMTDIVPFTRIFSYGESITIAFIGRNIEGVRAFSGLVGTANVIALWWLARQFLDRRVALIAALLLATFPPHIHFSRLALNNIADPLFATLAFGFLLRALRTEKRMDYALAGMCIGRIPYFYEGGRLLFPLITVLWGVWVIWFVWKQSLTALQRQNLMVFGMVTVIIAFPVYYNVASWTGNLTGRMAFSGLSGEYWESLIVGDTASALRGYADNLARSALFYVNRFEVFIHYGGTYGLILPALVPIFLLGLAYSLWGMLRRNAGLALIFLWFVAAVLGNSLLVDPGVSTRHVVTFPAVALLMALGLVWTVDLLAEKSAMLRLAASDASRVRIVFSRPRIKIVALIVVCLLCVGVAVREVDYYFNSHLPLLERQIRELAPYRDVTDALLRTVDLPKGTQVTVMTDFLFSGRDANDLLTYLVDGLSVTVLVNDDIPDDYFMLLDYTHPQAFFVSPDDQNTLALIRDYFGTLPDPQYTRNPYVTHDEAFVRYLLPPTVYNVPVDPATITVYNARHQHSLAQLGILLSIVVATVSTFTLLNRFAPTVIAPLKRPALNLLALFKTEEQQVSFIPRPSTFVFGVVVLVAVTLLNSSAQPNFVMPVWTQFGGLLAGVGLVVRGFLPDQRPPVENPPANTIHISQLVPSRVRRRLYRFLNPPPGALIQRPGNLMQGFVLLSLVTLANMIDRPEVCLPMWLQLGFFAGGVVLIVRGVSLTGNPAVTVGDSPTLPQTSPSETDFPPATARTYVSQLRAVDIKQIISTHQEAFLLSGILLLGLLLRVVNLEYGVHWFVDEMHSVQAVTDLRGMPYTAIFKPYGDLTAFTWLYPLLQTIGVGIYGNTLTGLRVVSALAGTATIWAVWYLARGLFDRRVALIAALVLATFPPHIHFSRIGINNIADPLFGTLALGFLAHAFALEKNRTHRLNFALAGVALGMTQYFYEGGRLLFPAMTLAWMLIWIVYRRFRVDWRGVFITAITFCLSAAPVYLTWQAGQLSRAPRLAANLKDYNFWFLYEHGQKDAALNEFVHAIRDPLKMLIGARDQSWFYGGDFGFILPFMIPFFVIGLLWVCWRFYQPRRILVLMWFGGLVIGIALLQLQREAPRYVVVFPLMALVIALGLNSVYGWLARVVSSARLRRNLLAGIMIVLCGAQVIYYFGMHLPHYNAQNQDAASFDDVLFRLVTLPTGTRVYIISDESLWVEDITTMLDFRGRREDFSLRVMTPDEIDAAFINDLPARGQFAFFVNTADQTVPERLSQRFELMHIFYSPYHNLPEDHQYALYFVSD